MMFSSSSKSELIILLFYKKLSRSFQSNGNRGEIFKRVFIFILFNFIIIGCGGQKVNSEFRNAQTVAINKLIERQTKGHHIPGIAVAVIKNGAVVIKITSGMANLEDGKPITENTSFQIASTTKSFTSMAIMLLVRDGTLNLTDKVGDLLTGLPESWHDITVRQLLTHTSGLPDISKESGGIDLIGDNWESASKIVFNSPLLFKAGESWSYGVTNYVLLFMIIEQKSGKSFSQFMNERLFQPLGMENTFFEVTNDIGKLIAVNYELDEEEKLVLRNLTFPKFVHAAGGLFSSLDDLIRWNLAIDSNKVLSKQATEEMWTSVSLNDGSKFRIDGKTIGYGFGCIVDDSPEQKAVGHSGGNSTAYRKFIDEDFTIIVLHNGIFDPDALIIAIASIMRSEPGEEEPTPQVRLWESAMVGDTLEIINSLKENADIEELDTRRSKSGRRALNWAAWFNHPEAIEVLIKKGADVNAANATGFTALHHAAEANSYEAANVLLANGANPNAVNRSGNDPAATARSNNHLKIAALIDSAKMK